MHASLAGRIRELAVENVFVGTSSWKYPGWLGQLYDEGRYLTRGKFSNAKFEASCLAEYAETFRTVCVDAGYYTFPTEKWLAGLAAMVPPDFLFGFKVTDEITLKRFPKLPRFGARGGEDNPHFLDAELFAHSFLGPCESIRSLVGPLIFEFSHFHPRDYARGRDFLPALDRFLGQLPAGWQYAVEIRNRNFLHPEYFAVLRAHGVAHCFNAWTRMPHLTAQLAQAESRTTDFFTARFLLTEGRNYDAAVTAFSPYTETKSIDLDARAAGQQLILEARGQGRRRSFIYVNNRLEGNALESIAAMLRRAEDAPEP